MRKKIGKISIVLSVSAFAVLTSVPKQKAEWKGRVEVEDGMRLVKNPGEPLYGEIKFELEEDLSIGREDDENYMFYGGLALALDKEENIYALDGKSFRIQKFDKQGRYIQTIGGKGQGPGEFEQPFSFFLDSKNSLYVTDQRSLEIFNGNGEFLRTLRLPAFFLDFYVNPGGNIFACSELRNEKGSVQAVIEIDAQGKMVKKIAEFPYVELVIRKSGEMTVPFGVSRHIYIPELHLSAINENAFCYAHSAQYKIFVLDKDGKTLLMFLKEGPSEAVSGREKDFILNEMKESYEKRGRSLPKDILEEVRFPAHRPFFDRILADDRQRLYVRKLKSVLDKTSGIEFDIFNKEGFYLYKTRLPFTPSAVGHGSVYHVDTNGATGKITIKRFKVRNWDQIKEAI